MEGSAERPLHAARRIAAMRPRWVENKLRDQLAISNGGNTNYQPLSLSLSLSLSRLRRGTPLPQRRTRERSPSALIERRSLLRAEFRARAAAILVIYGGRVCLC